MADSHLGRSLEVLAALPLPRIVTVATRTARTQGVEETAGGGFIFPPELTVQSQTFSVVAPTTSQTSTETSSGRWSQLKIQANLAGRT